MIGLILQARMSSNRLPGKVMSLIDGKPLIFHVVSQCRAALVNGPVIVCTSVEESDDPLFEYCEANNILVFRGSLNDVYKRYVDCIDAFGLTAFGRICCDSPGISAALISYAIKLYREMGTADLVTNVHERTFPVGQSIEIVNATTFKSNKFYDAVGFSREHVTQSFYNQVGGFEIYNIKNLQPDRTDSWGVDEPGDIERVSALLKNGYSFDEKHLGVEKRSALD